MERKCFQDRLKAMQLIAEMAGNFYFISDLSGRRVFSKTICLDMIDPFLYKVSG